MQTQSVDPSVSRTPLPLDADDLATACVLCSHNCGLRVDVRGRRDRRGARATSTIPITEGYVCNKAFSIAAYVEHAQRDAAPAASPARRHLRAHLLGHGDHARSPRKLRDIRDRHSPRAIALVGIGGQGNHMDGAYGVGFLRALGSRRWFNAFAQEKTQHNLLDQWMFDASPARVPPSRRGAQRASCWSSARTRRSPTAATTPPTRSSASLDEPGRTLVVVDPRETETTRGAHRHLRVRPGTDVYLLLALAAVIVREGLIDERVRRRAHARDSTPCAHALDGGGRRRDGASLRPRRRGDRGDGARLRERRVGRDLLRPRRRAGAVLDPQRVADPPAPSADRQRRQSRRRRLPRDAACRPSSTRA